MLPHLSRASARAASSRAASGRVLAVRFASTDAPDPNDIKVVNPKGLRTAFIRSWRSPNGVSEALLILAEIEKKYGKVLESHFLKDYEVPTKYQMMAFVVFEDPQSVERIPLGGIEHAVPQSLAESLQERMPHEIGLAEIEALVHPPENANKAEQDVQEMSREDVLGFRIVRAEKDYVDDKQVHAARNVIRQVTPGQVMENFRRWRGFYSEDPLQLPEKNYRPDELFNPKGVQPDIRMRAAVKLCEDLAKDPPNRTPTTTTQTETSATEASSASKNEASSTSTNDAPSPTASPKRPAPQEPSKPAEHTPETAEKLTPSIETAPPPPAVPTVEKPKLSEQEKAALVGQIGAARGLRKSAAPTMKRPPIEIPPSMAMATRRKQPKPRPAKTFVNIPTMPSEEPQKAASGGILGKLWGFVGGRKS